MSGAWRVHASSGHMCRPLKNEEGIKETLEIQCVLFAEEGLKCTVQPVLNRATMNLKRSGSR